MNTIHNTIKEKIFAHLYTHDEATFSDLLIAVNGSALHNADIAVQEKLSNQLEHILQNLLDNYPMVLEKTSSEKYTTRRVRQVRSFSDTDIIAMLELPDPYFRIAYGEAKQRKTPGIIKTFGQMASNRRAPAQSQWGLVGLWACDQPSVIPEFLGYMVSSYKQGSQKDFRGIHEQIKKIARKSAAYSARLRQQITHYCLSQYPAVREAALWAMQARWQAGDEAVLLQIARPQDRTLQKDILDTVKQLEPSLATTLTKRWFEQATKG